MGSNLCRKQAFGLLKKAFWIISLDDTDKNPHYNPDSFGLNQAHSSGMQIQMKVPPRGE